MVPHFKEIWCQSGNAFPTPVTGFIYYWCRTLFGWTTKFRYHARRHHHYYWGGYNCIRRTMDGVYRIKDTNSLKKSSFRTKFRLTQKDRDYIAAKGLETIKDHAFQFINTRVTPDFPKNDGKQTLMRGHPVFIAQHATATCFRGCISKVAWNREGQGAQWCGDRFRCGVDFGVDWSTSISKNGLNWVRIIKSMPILIRQTRKREQIWPGVCENFSSLLINCGTAVILY